MQTSLNLSDQLETGAPTTEVLHVCDLHKSFGELEVLKGVSMSARRGDVISILGSSGSGKSTLLRCLNLLETPTKGLISVDDEIVFDNTSDEAVSKFWQNTVARQRAKMPMVFQHFNLWSHMTILENVTAAPIYVFKRPAGESRELGMAKLGSGPINF